MKLHRFKSDEDLKRLFQQQLDKFPTIAVNGQNQSMFCEFGALMIRPRNEPKNRLTHLVFPETIVSLPFAGSALGQHSDRTYPQVRLLADAWRSDLFVRITGVHEKSTTSTEKLSLVLPQNQVFLNADLWEYFNPDDQARLMTEGGGPNKSVREWAALIKRSKESVRIRCLCASRSISPKEFIYNINQSGCVGTKESFFLMPRFVNSLLLENNYFEDEGFYEVASAHVHPIKELTGISEKLARKVGERVVNMTVSPNDVKYCRTSTSANNMLLERYLGLKKDTGETFMTIIGVDVRGKVVDIKHFDFGLIDDIEEMKLLNDRTIETIKSGKPDMGLVAAHYEYFNDPRFSSDRLDGVIGQHIGDPEAQSTF